MSTSVKRRRSVAVQPTLAQARDALPEVGVGDLELRLTPVDPPTAEWLAERLFHALRLGLAGRPADLAMLLRRDARKIMRARPDLEPQVRELLAAHPGSILRARLGDDTTGALPLLMCEGRTHFYTSGATTCRCGRWPWVEAQDMV